jgi:ATP synthase protein I
LLAVAGVESMSDGARDNGDRDSRPADEAALSARLSRLGERLGQARSRRSPENRSAPGASADPSAFARGLRLSSELVGGVVFGALVGWLFDRWLGTGPWGLIVFFLLGFAGGILSVVRSAGVVPPNRIDGKDQ